MSELVSRLTPEEDYERASMRLALYRISQQDLKTAHSVLTEEQEDELKSHAEKKLPEMLRWLNQRMRKTQRWKPFRHNAYQIAKVAVLVILVMNLGLSIAVATNANVRKMVMNFVSTMDESSLDMWYEEEGEIDVPEDWKRDYYPAYLPEGYKLSNYSRHGMIELVNEEDDYFSIDILDEHSYVSLNVEGAELEEVLIDNIRGTLIHKRNGDTCVTWRAGNCFFIITGSDENEVMLVAQSIKKIR